MEKNLEPDAFFALDEHGDIGREGSDFRLPIDAV